MNLTKCQLWLCILFISCTYQIWAQRNELEVLHSVSNILNNFGIDFLQRTRELAGDSINIALSPFTVWTLLAIILEGAQDRTARELEKALGIPSSNKSEFVFGYKSLSKLLMQPGESTQLDLSNAIFATIDQKLNRGFSARTTDIYGVNIISTDFSKPVQAQQIINNYVANATNGRTKKFVTLDDVSEAVILMVSTLYFKGEWKMPFNASYTTEMEFLGYDGTRKGRVQMMFQRGPYRYSYLQSLGGHAVELPYGKSEKFAMVVMLPRTRQKLSEFLNALQQTGFKYVLDLLARSDPDDEDGVEVYLPRFAVHSDLNLNAVLNSMGILDLFNPETANLLGMFPHYLSVTKVIQKAKIEVNEQGTVFEAVAGAELGYRTPPPKFKANRDFVYFVYEKETRGIIFAGTVTNPNTLSSGKQ